MLDNKYKKWYFKIIENAKTRENISQYEKHHIIPRFAGGTNDPANLVKLSHREHYICHLLLTKFTEGELKAKALYAIHRMCFSSKYGPSSKLYETFRIIFVEHLKHYHPSKKTPEKWKEMTLRNALKQWEGANTRREASSKKMKELWATGKLTKEQAKKNSQHGLTGKLNHKSLELEYKGCFYYGYRELQEKTGVTEHLYKKYYKRGIDPEFRIGKDGPISKKP